MCAHVCGHTCLPGGGEETGELLVHFSIEGKC